MGGSDKGEKVEAAARAENVRSELLKLPTPRKIVVVVGILLALLAVVCSTPDSASASCEVVNGTGEPPTPQKEAEWREWEEKCRAEEQARAEEQVRIEAEARTEQEAALASNEPCQALTWPPFGSVGEVCDLEGGYWRTTKKKCDQFSTEPEVPAVALTICWRLVAIQKAQQLPRERAEARREAKAARERARLRREWEHKPTVTLAFAEKGTRIFLRQNLGSWRHRSNGEVDCIGGKITRTRWSCHIAWIRGARCNVGRIQVFGAGHRNGRAIYRGHLRWQRGWGYTRAGRIHCPFWS
jgi:hypothetical protein